MLPEAIQCGNSNRMYWINELIKAYKPVFRLFDEGKLLESAYRVVLDVLLSKLWDQQQYMHYINTL